MRYSYIILLLFVFSFYTCFCQNSESYFLNLSKQIEKNREKSYLLKLAELEMEKFKKSKDSLHILAQKYLLLESNSDPNDAIKQLEIALELEKLNNERYSFITIHSNHTIATHLEEYSPSESEKYLDKAIEGCLKSIDKSILPHLYHLKGRLYFKKENYEKANEYFKKVIDTLKPDDFLYIASMYNNFGFVFERKKNYKNAVIEFGKGIEILSKKKNPTKDDLNFILLLNRNLADSYFKGGELIKAREIWEGLYTKYKNQNEYAWTTVRIARDLYDLYGKINNKEQQNYLVQYLKKYEYRKENNNYMNIFLNEMLLDNAFQQNNLNETRKYAEKIIDAKDKLLDEDEKYITESNNLLNKTIVESINKKYESKILDQQSKMLWVIIIAALSLIILLIILFGFINRAKFLKNKSLLEQENKEMLEKNLKLQNEKLKLMHLNLNLKQETEKAFLNKIKKIRKSKNIDIENVIKELYFELNNLVDIDKRNKEFQQESNLEANNFTTNLAAKYPFLSDKELQLCVYFKLNLSSKEISFLENLTEGSIRVYKSKIKAKLNIHGEASFADFLKTIE